MRDFRDEIRNINKDFSYNYSYEYFIKTDNGMEREEQLCEMLGQSRAGYDTYRKYKPDVRVSYGGVTSLRNITKDGVVVGYITETKLSENPHVEACKKLYDEALEYVTKELKVQDLENFTYYVQQNVSQWNFTREADTYRNGVDNILQLLEDYQEDEEFKKYFDKVIK